MFNAVMQHRGLEVKKTAKTSGASLSTMGRRKISLMTKRAARKQSKMKAVTAEGFTAYDDLTLDRLINMLVPFMKGVSSQKLRSIKWDCEGAFPHPDLLIYNELPLEELMSVLREHRIDLDRKTVEMLCEVCGRTKQIVDGDVQDEDMTIDFKKFIETLGAAHDKSGRDSAEAQKPFNAEEHLAGQRVFRHELERTVYEMTKNLPHDFKGERDLTAEELQRLLDGKEDFMERETRTIASQTIKSGVHGSGSKNEAVQTEGRVVMIGQGRSTIKANLLPNWLEILPERGVINEETQAYIEQRAAAIEKLNTGVAKSSQVRSTKSAGYGVVKTRRPADEGQEAERSKTGLGNRRTEADPYAAVRKEALRLQNALHGEAGTLKPAIKQESKQKTFEDYLAEMPLVAPKIMDESDVHTDSEGVIPRIDNAMLKRMQEEACLGRRVKEEHLVLKAVELRRASGVTEEERRIREKLTVWLPKLKRWNQIAQQRIQTRKASSSETRNKEMLDQIRANIEQMVTGKQKQLELGTEMVADSEVTTEQQAPVNDQDMMEKQRQEIVENILQMEEERNEVKPNEEKRGSTTFEDIKGSFDRLAGDVGSFVGLGSGEKKRLSFTDEGIRDVSTLEADIGVVLAASDKMDVVETATEAPVDSPAPWDHVDAFDNIDADVISQGTNMHFHLPVDEVDVVENTVTDLDGAQADGHGTDRSVDVPDPKNRKEK